jgi:hypothetical protein
MDNLINTQHMSIELVSIFGIGCVFWLLAYFIYVRNIIKIKYVEIPALVVCFNIAWEFVWSFVYGYKVGAYLGNLLWIGYAFWFFVDCFIFYGLMKYGSKQIRTPEFQKHFKPIMIVITLLSFVFFILFYSSGYDTEIGTISAYLDNLFISGLYIVLIFNEKDIRLFSKSVAWYKMLGTGLISLSLCIHWSNNHLLIFMCSVVLLLDLIYIFIFNRKLKSLNEGIN